MMTFPDYVDAHLKLLLKKGDQDAIRRFVREKINESFSNGMRYERLSMIKSRPPYPPAVESLDS